jgi:uncharacterized protein (TIGR00369 family)
LSIWKKNFTLESLNEMSKNTAADSLGIIITKVGDNTIEGKMPVDNRTHQVHGILHGGASVLFAETLGSIGGALAVDENHHIVGLEINANHVAGISNGEVIGIATAVHIGRSTHVWDIKISHEQSNKLICVSRITLAVIEHKK